MKKLIKFFTKYYGYWIGAVLGAMFSVILGDMTWKLAGFLILIHPIVYTCFYLVLGYFEKNGK